MTHTVDLRLVQKTLDRMDHAQRVRVLRAASRLANDPRLPGTLKLTGNEAVWRIRAGDFRILYTIEDARLVVLVLKVGHRREVYR